MPSYHLPYFASYEMDQRGRLAKQLILFWSVLSYLPEVDLGSGRVVHEPVCCSSDGGEANVGADGQVPEEQPGGDQGLVLGPGQKKTLIKSIVNRPVGCAPGRLGHDVEVRRIESEGGGWKAVGDEVDPKELNGDECLGEAEGGGQEDGDDLANVGRDQVADELCDIFF